MSKHINIAKEVLQIESEGINKLSDEFSASDSQLALAFSAAVERINAIQGRVIVTGMGKSGHIGRKIAATLASTGVPASYVHPGEASHGDLGMIAATDIVLALSNSGETPELRDILAYCGRFNIPLIAITSGAGSELDKAATISLLLPAAEEACEITRAPTTSTTMALIMGDALAVALLREKNFSSTDFRNFHPGGKLGAALKKVRDIMHEDHELPLCAEDTKIVDAIDMISQHGFGCVGVINPSGHLIGMVTDGDVRRHLTGNVINEPVSTIMTKQPITVTADTIAAEALGLLSGRRITALFVLEDRTPIGLLHVHDCLSIGVV
ncbi:MAG: KpsF/GutQ family sugar-phosphate isomerase [bacterium]